MGKKFQRNQLFKKSSVSQPNNQSSQQLTTVREEFSGPIPPPAVLERYNQIVPGAAERILAMAEKQSAHRMELEKIVITSGAASSVRGQWFGLFVALFGLLVTLILGLLGREIAATVVGAIDLVGLAGVFIYGSRKKASERKQAREESPVK